MLTDIYSVASTVQDLPHHPSSSASRANKTSKRNGNSTERRSTHRNSTLSRFISLFLVSTCLILIQTPSASALRPHTKYYTSRSTSHLIEYDEVLGPDNARGSGKIVKKMVKVDDEAERIRNGNHDLHIRGRRVKPERPHWGQSLEPVVRNDGIIWSDHLIVKSQDVKRSAETNSNFPTASAKPTTFSSSSSTSSTIPDFPAANLKVEETSAANAPTFPIASAVSSSSSNSSASAPPSPHQTGTSTPTSQAMKRD